MKRKMWDKWIFQKNISSKEWIIPYLQTVKNNKNLSERESIKNDLKKTEKYKGRSQLGSNSTMGVRLSQMFFYMFGYKKNNSDFFIPTQTTINILENKDVKDEIYISKNMLVNFFSIQFPSPYSKTNSNFSLYVGRLIINLLLEEKLKYKIFIDEFIWFLPFIQNITPDLYEKLINKILNYRDLPFNEKIRLFNEKDEGDGLFANCLHESKYYFLKIFDDFRVIKLEGDSNHNNGKIIKFKHGKTNTYRTDAIDEKPGYIKLNEKLLTDCKKLIKSHSPFDEPLSMKNENVFSLEDWKINLYESQMLKYLAIVLPEFDYKYQIISSINEMLDKSKYGSIDGKEFEKSLNDVFNLFREKINVENIGGSGNTDLLFSFDDDSTKIINKINIEAKSRRSHQNMNVSRILHHLDINNSKYCLIVSPRFSRANHMDIKGNNVVMLTSDVLAQYCLKECLSSNDNRAAFEEIHKIALRELGNDISGSLSKLIEKKYGYQK